MKKATLVKVAIQSIFKNKMRTALTMLGIVIGVAAVIIMVGIGYGAQSSVQKQVASLGTNMIMVFPGSSSQGGVSMGAGSFNRLTLQDAEKLKRESLLLSGLSPVVNVFTQAIYGANNWRTQVQGVDTDYQTIRDLSFSSGNWFSENDVRAMRKVAVLGQTTVKALFGEDLDPLGQQIQLRNVPFTVIGVLASKGQTMGMDQDDVILIPYTTAQSRLRGRSFINQIVGSTASAADIPAAQEEMREIMRESHKLGDAPDDFTIRNQNELADAMKNVTQVMTLLLAAIASISLLVGGIGIMNIMLVSVTERTREIGIRMAIGARGKDVLTQFLIESVVMSVMGGLIGLGVGFLGSALIGWITGWTTTTPPEAVLIAVGFSAGIGIFFGWYPARQAAALNPIQALRYE